MSFSRILNFLIFTLVALTDRSLCDSATSEPIIGRTACFLKGTYDITNACDLETVLCDKLPTNCSSYFWSSAMISAKDFTVEDPYGSKNDAYFKQLLHCTQKPVIVRYGYIAMAEWGKVFNNNGSVEEQVLTEIKSLNKYLESHPKISGLMLSNLDVDPSVQTYANFSQTLTLYINAYKKNMKTKMQIGVYLYADLMMEYYKNPTPEWIDFQTVPFDFILIAFNFMNLNCTADFKNIGMQPITGKVGKTLENFQNAVKKGQIPGKKLFYRFELHPENKEGSSYCSVKNSLMCLNPKKAENWCSDTIASYYAKGKYASVHASGFVGAHPDMDDPDNRCGCGQYPAFSAILAGFHNKEVPPPCPLIDRN